MTPRLTMMLCLAVLSTTGCSVVRPAPEPSSPEVRDAHLAAQITLLFHDRGLPDWEEIHVDVVDGRVTLRGEVTRASTAETAARLAASVEGVREVDAVPLRSRAP